jgi:hypothetical protein
VATLTRNTAGQAISRARMAARDKYVYRTLLERADNVSADGRTLSIPGRLQPAGQHDWIFGVSRRNVQRALAHLKLHGWLTSVFRRQGGEGHPPCHYTILVGSDCDCDPPVERQVKRQDGAQLEASRAPGRAPETHELSASVERQIAGQTASSTKGSSKEGKGWPEGTIGETANPRSAARLPGVRGTLVPTDPDTRTALRVLVDVLGPVEVLGAK